jgi:hypothetical protein
MDGKECYFRENYHHQIQTLLLEPLKKLYENDVKMADAKKRDFDQESDDYYSFLPKYLSQKNINDKKKLVLDQKFQAKKRHFDLARFDYLTFIQDLHGRKEQEILYHLSGFAERQDGFYSQTHSQLHEIEGDLVNLSLLVEQNTKSISHYIKEREEKRKLLNVNTEEEDGSSPLLVVITNNNQTSPFETSPSTPGANMEKFKGFRDLEYHDHSVILKEGRKKEGFLYAYRGQGGQSNPWKKLWVVLSSGQIHEYANWKDSMKLNNVIDLKFCTVREARTSDRRFCFEIISTQFKRMYQATSQEEMMQWIYVISNSIESLLNGTSSKDNLVVEKSPVVNAVTFESEGFEKSGKKVNRE